MFNYTNSISREFTVHGVKQNHQISVDVVQIVMLVTPFVLAGLRKGWEKFRRRRREVRFDVGEV